MSVKMVCHCGETYEAREADLKRGWGYSCGKSCAAIRRDFGRPKAKRIDGLKTKQAKRSPISARSSAGNSQRDEFDLEWYASTLHPFSSEGLGQDGF